MKEKDHTSAHWDLMLATVKEIAAQDNSSVNRLQQEFLEEFGRLPSPELIDYFADLLKTDSEKIKRKRQVRKKEIIKDNAPTPGKESQLKFTDKMAVNNQVTVLAFRKKFESTFGKEPPIELLAHFLKRIAYLRRQPSKISSHPDGSAEISFVNDFISGKSPTVLKFRQGFEKKFGKPPDNDMITLFLNKLSELKSNR